MSESKPPTIAKAEEESPLERLPPLHGALRVIGITSVAAMLIGLVAVLFEKLEALGDVIGKYVTGETGEVAPRFGAEQLGVVERQFEFVAQHFSCVPVVKIYEI